MTAHDCDMWILTAARAVALVWGMPSNCEAASAMKLRWKYYNLPLLDTMRFVKCDPSKDAFGGDERVC